MNIQLSTELIQRTVILNEQEYVFKIMSDTEDSDYDFNVFVLVCNEKPIKSYEEEFKSYRDLSHYIKFLISIGGEELREEE